MPPTFADGKVCYLQIPCADTEESSRFYARVFHWKIRIRDDGAVAFDEAAGEVSGAFVKNRPPQTALGILIYIMVDDMQSALDAVVANGGKIIQPVGADLPEITARFADPFGNILGLYQQRGSH